MRYDVIFTDPQGREFWTSVIADNMNGAIEIAKQRTPSGTNFNPPPPSWRIARIYGPDGECYRTKNA